MYQTEAKKLMRFISETPSCYHVIAKMSEILENEGFVKLREEAKWNLEAGKSYFVTRNHSSIIAFKIPMQRFSNFQIVAAHSDAPTFKVKENPEMCPGGQYVSVNVEKYGGMLCAPWFDRPLSIAGRSIVKNGDRYEMRLVNFDRDLVMIPNLAIHMNRQANDGYQYNAQKDMLPILAEKVDEVSVDELVAKELQVAKEDVISSDLFLYNRMEGCIWGANEEFISSTKLDDLECAYAALQGIIHGGNEYGISMCAIFDNEEVGSLTKQGADSTMLSDTLERICENFDFSREEYHMAVANSFMLSADNAHAAHPQHLEKADPTNQPYMNGGVVIKYNANQKYTTDSVSAAIFKEICKEAGVPVQSYVNRSDVAGGSTLGNISNAHVSLNTVDIGLAQLAMHSPYETGGVKDPLYLIQAITAFYNSEIQKEENSYQIRK